MKRDGTKYAILFSKKFTLFRAKGDALTLCDYIEADSVDIDGYKSLAITHSEEVDLILYEVDPKNIDDKKFYQADKIAGFPYVDISKDPVVNSLFIEKKTGKKWIVIKALSSDPIDAFSQVGLKRYYGQESVSKNIKNEESSISIDEFQLLRSDMIHIRKTTGAIPQTPPDVLETVVMSDISVSVVSFDRPKVAISYEGSFSLRATGSLGGKIWFQMQRSFQLETDPEVWENIAGTEAPYTLLVGQEVRRRVSFDDRIPAGIPSDYKLSYRLQAMSDGPLYTVVLNSSIITGENPNPGVMIGLKYNYQEPDNIEFNLSESVTANDVITLIEGILIQQVAESVSASDDITLTPGTLIPEIEESVSASDDTTLAPGILIQQISEPVTASDDTTLSQGVLIQQVAESVTASDDTSLTPGIPVTELEESSTATEQFNLLVPDPIFNAPPANPVAQPLVTGEFITETTVTIPAEEAGYQRVRFLYSASLQFIFTGASGGSTTLQVEKSEDGGAWADVDSAIPLSSTIENHEERTTIIATDEYETGIAVDTAVQYRVKVTVATDVSVHSSLIDPNNTAPVCLVSAEYGYEIIVPPVALETMATGFSNSLMIEQDSTLWSCGEGSQGALGQGPSGNISTFTQVGSDTDWSEVDCGFQFSIALKSGGTLWSCGLNGQNQLGRTGDVNYFLQVGSASNWTEISAGGLHTAALQDNNTLWTWGLGVYGQLGNGDTSGRAVPTQAGTDTNWSKIACSDANTYAIKTDGTIWGAGDGSSGQLGNGGSASSNVMVQVGADNNFAEIAAGGNFVAAIKSDGTLWTCGSNTQGQLGRVSDPTLMLQVGSDTDWSTVNCGSNFLYAVKSNGEVWGCGTDVDGQLGELSGSTGTMTKLSNDSGWVVASCGEKYVFIQNEIGELWVTGTGDYGELGLGDELPRSIFTEVTI